MYSGIHADPDGDRVVIYRRSPKSITMRCNKSEGMQTACDRVTGYFVYLAYYWYSFFLSCKEPKQPVTLSQLL
jgi:hypothetical protein